MTPFDPKVVRIEIVETPATFELRGQGLTQVRNDGASDNFSGFLIGEGKSAACFLFPEQAEQAGHKHGN